MIILGLHRSPERKMRPSMDKKQKVHFPFLDSTLLCCSLLDRQTPIFNVPLPQVKNGCESDLDGQVGKEKNTNRYPRNLLEFLVRVLSSGEESSPVSAIFRDRTCLSAGVLAKRLDIPRDETVHRKMEDVRRLLQQLGQDQEESLPTHYD
jgi:hypothetical protein